MSNPFKGLGVAMVTPFTTDGKVDVVALKKLTAHLIVGGVDYLVPLGTTAETATLTEDEHRLVVDTIVEENNRRLPVLLGAGGNDTRAVAEKMAAYQKQWDIAGFLSVSPYYNRPTQAGIYAHFAHLTEATNKPLVLYNVPPRTGSNMLPETVLRLANDFRQIVAVKEASGSLAQGMEILAHKPAHFDVLSGDDLLAFPSICLGYEGVISVIGNALPQPMSRMVHLARTQEMVGARTLHAQLHMLFRLIFEEGNPAGVKTLLSQLTLATPHVRLPLLPASDGLSARIREALQAVMPATVSV